jgi:tetratricopeptide (TPR) repeat protein
MHRSRLHPAVVAIVLAGPVWGAATSARAQTAAEAPMPPPPPPPPPHPSDPVEQARALFRQGVELVRSAQWSDALSAFERSAALRSHATTTFNVGACERAMGRYTAARESFRRALERAAQTPDELAPSLAEEARAFIAEIDGLLVRVSVHVDPPDTALAVDGRPVTAIGGAHVAGLEQPGPGKPLGTSRAVIELNPGTHVFTLGRKGYADAVVNRSFAAGMRGDVELELARLPATLQVSSNVSGALVMVDERDLGPVPVSVLRPAGNYRVVVSKEGYEPYEAQVAVQAGEEAALRARLVEEKQQVTKKWWFWTAAALVVAGGAVATYAFTRPDPEPPPYDGGSTGWVVYP